jgi:hypothetical protein
MQMGEDMRLGVVQGIVEVEDPGGVIGQFYLRLKGKCIVVESQG